MSFCFRKIGVSLVVCSMLVLVGGVGCQATERPDSGTILQETQKPTTVFPQPTGEAQIQVNEQLRPPLVGGSDEKIPVKGFHITGQNIFPEADLLKLVADSTNKDLTLPEIQEVGNRIAAYFHKQGYFMAGVYVPEQQLKDGVVELAIVVGRYDKIIYRKKVEIADAQLNLQLGQVKSGGYIKKDGLERAIWLLGDLSGVEAKATLAPGSKTGTADLYLDILPKDKTISGDVGVDNYGNGYTGANELFTDMVIRNPFHLGDQLNLYGLITGGNGLNSGSITYDVPLLTDSGKLEMSYSHLHYLLGGVYDSLDANGIADTTSLAYKYTFHRSREANFYGQVGFAEKQLMDNVSGVPDNKASGEMFIGINGDSLDKWGGGGSNNYSLIATHGVLNFQSSVYQGVDAATTKSSGSFDRLNFTASRQQYINDRLTFVTLLSAQAADKNLDSSEQMILGGANGVRAYPQGEGAGDEGALLNCELRWSLPLQGKKDQLFQLVSFFDAGSTVLNKFQYAGSATPNVETLMGAGVGAVWNNPGVFTLRACYAWKVGYAPQVTDASAAGRVWVQGIYYY